MQNKTVTFQCCREQKIIACGHCIPSYIAHTHTHTLLTGSLTVNVNSNALYFMWSFCFAFDFHCVPKERAKDGYQYISPNLTFPCDGAVTKWKIGTENKDDRVYSRVTETSHTNSGDATISEVTTNMTQQVMWLGSLYQEVVEGFEWLGLQFLTTPFCKEGRVLKVTIQ